VGGGENQPVVRLLRAFRPRALFGRLIDTGRLSPSSTRVLACRAARADRHATSADSAAVGTLVEQRLER